MLECLQKHDIKHLVVEKVDRLTRNSKSAIVIDDWLDEDQSRMPIFPKMVLFFTKGRILMITLCGISMLPLRSSMRIISAKK